MENKNENKCKCYFCEITFDKIDALYDAGRDIVCPKCADYMWPIKKKNIKNP